MATELTRFDAAEHLTEPEDQAELLAAALRARDLHAIATAIETVARALGFRMAIETDVKYYGSTENRVAGKI